jgi:hypothetical protein
LTVTDGDPTTLPAESLKVAVIVKLPILVMLTVACAAPVVELYVWLAEMFALVAGLSDHSTLLTRLLSATSTARFTVMLPFACGFLVLGVNVALIAASVTVTFAVWLATT